MNRDQADALARFITLCRPEWQHAGIFRALGDAKDADPLQAAMAALRWTADPKLRTPGGMGRQGDHWRERVAPPQTPRPPRTDEACRVCGRALHAADAVCDQPTTRPTPKPADVSSRVAVLRTNIAPIRSPKTLPPEEPA